MSGDNQIGKEENPCSNRPKDVSNLDTDITLYHSSFMVDTGHVDSRMETNTGWLLRVIFVTK